MKQDNYKSMVTEPISFEMSKLTKRKVFSQLQKPLSEAFNDAQKLITTFDKSILKCKKYNEDRSYKKYQTYIKDLEKANEQLRMTISILEQTISPTKQYMMDLLDKIIQAKHEKQFLNKQIQQLKEDVKLKQLDLQQYKMDVVKFQRIIKTNKVQKLPPIEENLSQLEDTLKNYLKQKQKVRRKVSLPPSFLQFFIIDNRKNLWSWSLFKFLQQFQKYMQTADKPKQTQDLWRAEFRASKQFYKLVKSTKHTKTTSTKRSLLSINKDIRKKSQLNTSVMTDF